MCRVCGQRPSKPNRRKCGPCSMSPHECTLDGCKSPRYSRQTGLCRGHHKAYVETGSPHSRRRYTPQAGCNWPLCAKKARRNGFCQNHSATVYRMQAERPAVEKPVDAGVFVELVDRSFPSTEEAARHIAQASGRDVDSCRRILTRVKAGQESVRFWTADALATALGRHVDELLGAS